MDDHMNEAGEGSRPAMNRAARIKTKLKPKTIVIEAGRSGDWLPAEELQQKTLAAMRENNNIVLDLCGLDHLDASSLQILMALATVLTQKGVELNVIRASASLRKWFEHAGATQHFSFS